MRATETGANAASANRCGRRSSAVARANASRASGPTTAFEPSAVVSSITEAKPGRRRPPPRARRGRSRSARAGSRPARGRALIGHHQTSVVQRRPARARAWRRRRARRRSRRRPRPRPGARACRGRRGRRPRPSDRQASASASGCPKPLTTRHPARSPRSAPASRCAHSIGLRSGGRLAVERRRGVGGEELEAHPRSFSWSGS